ncbi:MAG TPA: NrfD/PsrC family molybdoenzyme membrane anchor subunit [Candidatus Limnocylindrales bacterium]|nr:NrfD/PsrC family molybdoenzyme membrane anchor subunit [Candidatus Limnocylindrales bacterium]
MRHDGRDIDIALATLSGEGAQQIVSGEEEQVQKFAPKPYGKVPGSEGADVTYYDRPMLKQSVWSVDIPIYYFLGGAAGAAMTLGAAVQLACRDCQELREFSSVCHWTGVIGSTAGAAFLIHDLGRPSRFINMMRVFRPTSPMNMGSWILAAAAPASIATGLFINRGGFLGRVGELCGYISGVFGTMLAGYTGVLVSNTAIPAWIAGRKWMPVLFISSGAASAASVLDLFYESPMAQRITLMYGTAARAMEIAAAHQVERAAAEVERVAEPFRRGGTAVLWKGAEVLTAASLVVSLLPAQSRRTRQVAGVLGLLGSFTMRFAVHYVSNASARDARASFRQQREGVG